MSDISEAREVAEAFFNEDCTVDKVISVLYEHLPDYRFYVAKGAIIMEGDETYSPAQEVCKVPNKNVDPMNELK